MTTCMTVSASPPRHSHCRLHRLTSIFSHYLLAHNPPIIFLEKKKKINKSLIINYMDAACWSENSVYRECLLQFWILIIAIKGLHNFDNVSSQMYIDGRDWLIWSHTNGPHRTYGMTFGRINSILYVNITLCNNK